MTKKAVISVSMYGDKTSTNAKDIFIGAMKVMIPGDFEWKKSSKDKNRIRALKVVAGTKGINGISLDGEGKNQLVVIGEQDFDPVNLTNVLRCKVGHADLVSVDSSYKEKKEEKKETDKAGYVHGPVPSLHFVDIPDNPGCNGCRIM